MNKVDYADIKVLEGPDSKCPECERLYSVCYCEILDGLDQAGNKIQGEAFYCHMCDGAWTFDDYMEIVNG